MKPFTAAELAYLLSTEVFDAEQAAEYLGIARNSIEYAAYRKRIAYVAWAGKKLFVRADLDAYVAQRGKGRGSHLRGVEPIAVEDTHRKREEV